jgi:hypothetical protein
MDTLMDVAIKIYEECRAKHIENNENRFCETLEIEPSFEVKEEILGHMKNDAYTNASKQSTASMQSTSIANSTSLANSTVTSLHSQIEGAKGATEIQAERTSLPNFIVTSKRSRDLYTIATTSASPRDCLQNSLIDKPLTPSSSQSLQLQTNEAYQQNQLAVEKKQCRPNILCKNRSYNVNHTQVEQAPATASTTDSEARLAASNMIATAPIVQNSSPRIKLTLSSRALSSSFKPIYTVDDD